MNTNSRNVFGRVSVTSLQQLIAWGDHFKVGQSHIDAQHEAIFDVAMEIARLWEARGDIDRLRRLTEKLELVLAVHFRYEEEQLAVFGYPKLEEHRAEHKAMLGELHGIRRRLGTMEDTDQMGPGFMLHEFVLGLTVGHISHSDMDYSELARKQADKADHRPDAVTAAGVAAGARPPTGERVDPIPVKPAGPSQTPGAGAKAPGARELPLSRD